MAFNCACVFAENISLSNVTPLTAVESIVTPVRSSMFVTLMRVSRSRWFLKRGARFNALTSESGVVGVIATTLRVSSIEVAFLNIYPMLSLTPPLMHTP